MVRRRTIGALALVVVVVLLAAVPAVASAGSSEPYGWDLQLRNTAATRFNADLTYKQFAAWVAKAHRQVSLTQDGVTYKGPSLRTLVGYFDDGNRKGFSDKLADAGYNVSVLGMDGYSHTFSSTLIQKLGDRIIVASLGNGAALPVPSAFLRDGLPLWVPDWPLRIVSIDQDVVADDQVRGIVRVSILPLTSPNTPFEPYAWDLQLRNTVTKKYDADMTAGAWSAWAGKAGRRVTVTESFSTTLTVQFSGVSLKTLVGYFDDNNKNTFNAALAAKGYAVEVLGMDGYSAMFSSAEIAALGDKVIMADLAAGGPLKVPPAFMRDGRPEWEPSWPLRVASADPSVIDDDKVLGVVRVSIVPLLK